MTSRTSEGRVVLLEQSFQEAAQRLAETSAVKIANALLACAKLLEDAEKRPVEPAKVLELLASYKSNFELLHAEISRMSGQMHEMGNLLGELQARRDR